MSITIFLDMDGVIADFEQHVSNLMGTPFDNIERNKMYRTADTEGFFSSIPPMDDMHVLMDGILIHKLPVFILSATGHHSPDRVFEEKNKWLDMHLGMYDLDGRHFVERSAEKAVHAEHERCILIDDRLKAVEPFREAGGTAIWHKNAVDTLTELNFLVKELS